MSLRWAERPSDAENPPQSMGHLEAGDARLIIVASQQRRIAYELLPSECSFFNCSWFKLKGFQFRNTRYLIISYASVHVDPVSLVNINCVFVNAIWPETMSTPANQKRALERKRCREELSSHLGKQIQPSTDYNQLILRKSNWESSCIHQKCGFIR